MPIDRETFDRGEEAEEIQTKVRDFLQEYSQRAFTVSEIAEAVSDQDLSESEAREQTGKLTEYQLDMVSVKTALINLSHRGAVERRLIEDERGARKYYRGKAS